MLPAISGSVGNMLRMMKLEQKWNERQQKGFAKEPQKENPQIAQLREDAARLRKSNAISSIDAKLKAGGELSGEELDYLRANSPELYRKAVQAAQERAAYKKALAQCKTKEDVQRLNTARMQSFMSEAKTISQNPNIGTAKKLELMEQVTRKLMGVKSEHGKFMRSATYADLPTEEELRSKAKKEKKEKTSAALPEELAELPKKKEPELTQRPADNEEQDGTSANEKPAEESDAAKPPQTGGASETGGAPKADGTPKAAAVDITAPTTVQPVVKAAPPSSAPTGIAFSIQA